MIDHIALEVGDYRRSKDFYLPSLAALGYGLLREFEGRIGGFGRDGKPSFWIREGEPHGTLHVAFAARNRDEVEAFYAAAVAAGGEDNGPPGLRAHYHPNYYGAFVLDPDGNNIEAVCHHREEG
jgi:catechol 2,3-dioxygenase-like lactoylglutathione lyase family enzyme